MAPCEICPMKKFPIRYWRKISERCMDRQIDIRAGRDSEDMTIWEVKECDTLLALKADIDKLLDGTK